MVVIKIRLSNWEKDLLERLSSIKDYDVSRYATLILIGYDHCSIISPPSRIRFLCGMGGVLGILRDVSRYPIAKNNKVYPKAETEPLRFELEHLRERVLESKSIVEDRESAIDVKDCELTAISIRFSVEGVEKIDRDAKNQNLSRNEYIRQCFRNRRLPDPLPGINEEINQSLNHLRSQLMEGNCNMQEWVQAIRSWQ
jgi:hypothetical protein